MSKLLSIAIPTYNRSQALKNTLENFISQILFNHLEKTVEIVVSDNASTDNTCQTVTTLQQDYSAITLRYSKNAQNILWENIQKAASLCQADYVWFCGDDDIYFHNAVEKIVHILSHNSVDAVYVNQVNGRGYITPIPQDEIVTKDRFFQLVHQDPEFISTVIVKRDKISPTISIHTWYHLACLLNLPQDAKFYITKQPFVYNKPATRTWVNKKNLINYTFDAIETIKLSNASTLTKKRLLNIYSIIFIKLNYGGGTQGNIAKRSYMVRVATFLTQTLHIQLEKFLFLWKKIL